MNRSAVLQQPVAVKAETADIGAGFVLETAVFERSRREREA